MAEKIQTKSVWDEKYLRESVWMPFGSMCNLIGQSLAGKDIDTARLEELATKTFELAINFTKVAFERVEKSGGDEPDIPIK